MCFKYEEYFSHIDCPSKDCEPGDRMAYRLVLENVRDESFLPLLIMDPDQIRSSRFHNKPASVCLGYALSFFDSMENAEQHFLDLVEDRPKVRQKWTHVAEGQLSRDDGVMSAANQSGHFSFHEYREACLSPKFTIVSKLPEA